MGTAVTAPDATAIFRQSVGNSLGAGLGPLLSGAIYDMTNSYLAIYVVAVTLVVTALGSLVTFLRATRTGASTVARS